MTIHSINENQGSKAAWPQMISDPGKILLISAIEDELKRDVCGDCDTSHVLLMRSMAYLLFETPKVVIKSVPGSFYIVFIVGIISAFILGASLISL